MISAFGVEHGVSKSWKKLAPKLARVNNVAKPGQSMQQRMRVNYSQWRFKSGYQGKETGRIKQRPYRHEGKDHPLAEYAASSRQRDIADNLATGKKHKEASRVMVTGISANNRRNRKPLP